MDLSRLLTARALWFLPEASLAGQPLRPVSIASWHAMRLMGLSLFDDSPDPAAEPKEIAVFYWLHARSNPVADIKAAVWDGSWRALAADLPELPGTVVNEFRALRAARTRVIPRPRSTSSSSDPIPPDDLIGPGRLIWEAIRVHEKTGLPWEQVLWDFPYAQALGILHAADWAEGLWTVPDLSSHALPAPFPRTRDRLDAAADLGDLDLAAVVGLLARALEQLPPPVG